MIEIIICSKCEIEYEWSEALNDMACPKCERRSFIYSKEWMMKSHPVESTHLTGTECEVCE